MEILMVEEEIRDLIMKGAGGPTLTEKAVKNGMMTLKMVGVEAVKNGISSMEEIMSVTGSGE